MPTLWTPAELGTRVLNWGDASVSADITVNSGTNQVTAWANKGSGASAFVPTTTGTAAPNYDPATYLINGLPGVRFGGTAAGFTMPALPVAPTDLSAFFVYQDDNATLSQSLFSSLNGAFGLIAQKGANSNSEITRNLSVQPTFYRVGAAYGTPTYRSDAWDMLVDSGTPTLLEFINFESAGAYPLNRVFQAPSSFNFKGVAGEFLFVQDTLSTDDRQKIEGYLAHKWGLTAKLPSDHPYKTTPPYVGSTPVYDVITLNASATASGGSGALTAIRPLAATSASASGSSATVVNAGTPAQPKKNILLAASATNSGAVAALRAIRKIVASSGSLSGSSAALRAIRKLAATSATASGSSAVLNGITRMLLTASASASGGSATLAVRAAVYVPLSLFVSETASGSTVSMKRRSATTQWGDLSPGAEAWTPIVPESEVWTPLR